MMKVNGGDTRNIHGGEKNFGVGRLIARPENAKVVIESNL